MYYNCISADATSARKKNVECMHILLIQITCQNSSSVYYFRQRDILIFESDFFMFWLFCKLLHIKVGKVLFAWLQQTIPDAADIFPPFSKTILLSRTCKYSLFPSSPFHDMACWDPAAFSGFSYGLSHTTQLCLPIMNPCLWRQLPA